MTKCGRGNRRERAGPSKIEWNGDLKREEPLDAIFPKPVHKLVLVTPHHILFIAVSRNSCLKIH